MQIASSWEFGCSFQNNVSDIKVLSHCQALANFVEKSKMYDNEKLTNDGNDINKQEVVMGKKMVNQGFRNLSNGDLAISWHDLLNTILYTIY